MTVLGGSSSISGRVLSIDGPLWTPVARDLRHDVKALLRRGERQIVLDLARVSRIDAAGIGELVRAYNMARAVDGTLRVANPSAWVRELIELVGLGDFLFIPGTGLTRKLNPSSAAVGILSTPSSAPAFIDRRRDMCRAI
jgi:anti-anti-sigma factor